jgi:uncharacterized protein (TIGR02271 family)
MGRDQEEYPLKDADDKQHLVVPVIGEEIVAGTKQVKTGAVRVDKHIERRFRTIEAPLLQEQVEVRRVPVNRVVSEAPGVRKNGDTLIIPVIEEELVITKRLVVREEIHLVTRRKRGRFVKEVAVDRERAEVHRLGADGQPVDRQPRLARRNLRGRKGPD